MTDDNPYKIAYEREKKARLEAENLLEEKSRSLYLFNKELTEANQQLKNHQAVMLRNDKFATIGTLSAGIAHEINNPLAFISSNIEMLTTYWKESAVIFSEMQKLMQSGCLSEETLQHLKALIEEHDVVFIYEDTPELLSDTAEGLVRVKEIVQNLRSFARSKPTDNSKSDINKGIQNTLKLLNSQIIDAKVVIELDLQPIPDIMCNYGEVNQVFLNIIVNAIHAMEHSPIKHLCISSQLIAEKIQLTIADTGSGIPEELISEIFSPFFTTKDEGKGTGMGLSIANSIIRSHGGNIYVTSEPNKGTIFTVTLPLVMKKDASP